MTDDYDWDVPTRMWTIGDYPAIARHILPISVATVDALAIQPGERVLDIGVGDGNAAILAAQRGAEVTGIDLTPAQVDRARDRCAAEGVDVDLRVGDAQDLDVADGSFDVVMSVMGLIFAPRYEAAARELGRVCRLGGRIALTAWAKAGWAVAWRSKVASFIPDKPLGPLPDEWGDPQVATMRLQAAGLQVTVEPRAFAWRFPSAELALHTFVTAGPFVMFMEEMRVEGKTVAARKALLEAMDETNVATDGTCVLPASYLLITATR